MELATLAAGVAAGVAALLAVAFVAVEVAVQHLPASLETRLLAPFGAWLDVEDEDDPRGEALEALLLRLATHWPGNPYRLRARIAAGAAPNAYALPGGTVVVTEALLDAVESENELAFVLGHELGHLRHRDHLGRLGRGLVLQLALASLVGAGGPDTLPALLAALGQAGFDRDQERAADRFAQEILAREYGHVAGADHLFGRLPDAALPELGARVASWLSTHPLGPERSRALEEARREAGHAPRGMLTPLSPTLR